MSKLMKRSWLSRQWSGLTKIIQKHKIKLLSIFTFFEILLINTAVRAQVLGPPLSQTQPNGNSPVWQKQQTNINGVFDDFLPKDMQGIMSIPVSNMQLWLFIAGGALIATGVWQIVQGRGPIEVWAPILLSLGTASICLSMWGKYVFGA